MATVYLLVLLGVLASFVDADPAEPAPSGNFSISPFPKYQDYYWQPVLVGGKFTTVNVVEHNGPSTGTSDDPTNALGNFWLLAPTGTSNYFTIQNSLTQQYVVAGPGGALTSSATKTPQGTFEQVCDSVGQSVPLCRYQAVTPGWYGTACVSFTDASKKLVFAQCGTSQASNGLPYYQYFYLVPGAA